MASSQGIEQVRAGATVADHIALTRFSMKLAASQGALDLDWLTGRLVLLEKYCLPGFASQTDKRFRWFLLCDETTDARCLARLTDLISPVRGATLLMTSPSRSWRTNLRDYLSLDADVLISSRVDSDDGLATDYIEKTNGYLEAFVATGEHAYLINFPQGLKLDASNGDLYDSFQPHGPFLTLFERRRASLAPRTGLSINHGHIYLSYPTHLDSEKPYWLQVVHGGNVSNHVRATDTRLETPLDLQRFVTL